MARQQSRKAKGSVGAEFDVSHDPVMARIGLRTWNAATSRWRWEIANWYATVAQKNLDPHHMSEGDWLNLQEEIRALRVLILHEDDPKPVSRAAMRAFQKELLRRLDGLADEWIVEFTQPAVHIKLRCDEMLAAAYPAAARIGPYGVNGLLYHFGELLIRTLERNLRAVRRCPRCQRIFIQLRRHAEYCSRLCQSRAAMSGKEENT